MFHAQRVRSLSSFPSAATSFLIAAAFVGCGPAAPGVHPVEGRFIASDGGDVGLLGGHIVEVRLESDPLVRASGEIAPDGSFKLETLHQGDIVEGAFEGAHQVRILLSDDDRERKAAASKALSQEMLDFEKSGLRIASPPPTAPQLEIRLKR